MCVCLSCGWLGCLAQGCPEVALSPSLCRVSPARTTRTSPFLREWSLLPQVPASESWHSQATGDLPSRRVQTAANYHQKFSGCFQLLQGDPLPRTRTNLPEEDFAENFLLLLAQSISAISSLRFCSTQRAALSLSVVHSLFSFPVHCLLEYVLIPCLQQLLRFTKNLRAVIFSEKTLCNFTIAANTEQIQPLSRKFGPNANYLWLEYFLHGKGAEPCGKEIYAESSFITLLSIAKGKCKLLLSFEAFKSFHVFYLKL